MIKIFNIERFATHDGSGIRTVVFMQGCPLCCPWCSNPESQSLKPQLFYTKKDCVLCRGCESSCPTKAISFPGGIFRYNKDICNDCRHCEETCPTGAIEFTGEERTAKEILNEVQNDVDYYKNSRGGVTLSGGEPFVQFCGMMELLQLFREHNIHTTVETTGQYPQEQLEAALPMIDAFLFDIKHLDGKRLKETINGDIDQIMLNFRYLAERAPEKLTVRVPVIPEFNHQESILKDIIRLASSYKLKEVDLLPYHTLGKNKYDKMLKPYPMGEIPMMDKRSLEPYCAFGTQCGVNVRIGG